MKIRHYHLLSLLSLPFVLACSVPNFGGDTEYKSLTYAQYVDQLDKEGFDPVGAADIYYRCFSTIDSTDIWWRFTISEQDFDQLVAATVNDDAEPQSLTWNDGAVYPPSWEPYAPPPMWWRRTGGNESRSTYWCCAAGTSERHHAWYIMYESGTQTAWFWRWNHQWSSHECRHKDGRETAPDSSPGLAE